MELEGPKREYVRQKLYRVFHIKDEEYIVTLKLIAIYKWKQPDAGDTVFEALKKVRAENKQFSNKRTIDFLYEKSQDALYRQYGRHAPPNAHPPDGREAHIGGWRVA